MKKLFISILFLFPLMAVAVETIDLTNPEYDELSITYPNYEVISWVNFSDTLGTEFEYNSVFLLNKDADSDNFIDAFILTISSSEAGEKKLYINTSKTCKNEYLKEDTVIRTNSINVEYSELCDGENYYYTPSTKKGTSYVINELKKSEMVVFDFNHIPIMFDATGFTKAWDNYGRDAI